MKKNYDWKKNKVVKRIIELQKTYVFRHMFAGTASFGEPHVWSMWECSCCGNLTARTESLYHKDPENTAGISICPTCSELWRAVGRYYSDWKAELLKYRTEEEIETWLNRNPKPDHFMGSDHMWMYEEAPHGK